MKKIIVLTLTLLLCACGGEPPASTAVTLENSSGTWRVINYWAQWCKPCIKEIPELNELAHKHPEITVLGVNYDGATGEQLAQQVAELGITFTNLATDPAAELGMERPRVLPTTVILTPTGELSTTLVGPQTLASLLRATIGE
jgi:thiol-disulfide isomerase/thioredoxin